MSALISHSKIDYGDTSKIIPLYPEMESSDEKKAQVIPFNVEPVINNLRDDYAVFSGLFIAGKKTFMQNLVYSLELEQKLRGYNIPLELFVKATV